MERIQADTDRDNFMGAEQSRDYGLIDDILVARGAPAE
jgi:ATP-dependent Clp protease protease subunit